MTNLFPRLGCAVSPATPDDEMIASGTENNPTVFTKCDRGFPRDVANDVYVSMIRARPAEYIEAENAIEALIEAARANEWVLGGQACPECRMPKATGHHGWCKIGSAISRIESLKAKGAQE